MEIKSIRIPNILKIYARILFLVSIISSAAMTVHAAQIAPNPNPAGNTITVTGADSNSPGPVFMNLGTLNINPGGALDNSGVLENHSTLTNNGTLNNSDSLANDTDAVLTNNGTLSSSDMISNYGTLTNNGTLTNSGWLRNFGTIEISPTGTLTQAATATYSQSGSIILNGTLTNNQNAAFNVNSLTVDSSETGVLSGTGTSAITTGNMNGTLNYTGTNSLSFTTLNLTGGVFNNNGTGSVTINTAAVIGGSTGTIGGTGTTALQTANVGGTLTISAILSGVGSLTKTGAGTLTLTGANTYTGTTTINEGVLNVNGSLLSSNTIVTALGTLGGIGTVQSVTNSGRISPGNSIGTLTITGSYTHNAGAVYEVEVDASGNSDLIDVVGVPGTATINGGTVDVRAASGNYGYTTNYTILKTTGGVTGTFDTVISNLAFLDPSLIYNPSSIVLTLTRNNVAFTSVGRTHNERAVGTAFDQVEPTAAGDMLTVLNALTGLSAPEARLAFNQTGGASHTAYIETSFDMASQYMRAIAHRMSAYRQGLPLGVTLMSGPGTSVSSFSGPQLAMAMGPFMNDGGPLLLALGNVEDPKSRSNWGIWARAFGAAGDRDGDDIASKYDYSIYGTVLGLDWKVSEKLFLGVSGGYTDTDLDFDDLKDKGEVNSYQAALYGSYTSGPWYADGLFSYARNRYDTSRGILFGSINRTAKGDYDGDEVSGYLEGGYRFKYRGFDIQPLASLQVIYLSQESYTETGAGALNLVVDGEDTTSFVGTLGVRVAKEFDVRKGVKVIPEVRARWAHEFSNEDYLVNAHFEGSTTGSFRVEGDKPNRNSGLLGLGFTIRAHKDFNFSVDYDADVSRDRTVQALKAGVTFTW